MDKELFDSAHRYIEAATLSVQLERSALPDLKAEADRAQERYDAAVEYIRSTEARVKEMKANIRKLTLIEGGKP